MVPAAQSTGPSSSGAPSCEQTSSIASSSPSQFTTMMSMPSTSSRLRPPGRQVGDGADQGALTHGLGPSRGAEAERRRGGRRPGPRGPSATVDACRARCRSVVLAVPGLRPGRRRRSRAAQPSCPSARPLSALASIAPPPACPSPEEVDGSTLAASVRRLVGPARAEDRASFGFLALAVLELTQPPPSPCAIPSFPRRAVQPVRSAALRFGPRRRTSSGSASDSRGDDHRPRLGGVGRRPVHAATRRRAVRRRPCGAYFHRSGDGSPRPVPKRTDRSPRRRHGRSTGRSHRTGGRQHRSACGDPAERREDHGVRPSARTRGAALPRRPRHRAPSSAPAGTSRSPGTSRSRASTAQVSRWPGKRRGVRHDHRTATVGSNRAHRRPRR